MKFHVSRAFAAKKAIQPQLDAFKQSLIFVETANDIRAFQTLAKGTELSINSINAAAKASARMNASELVKVAHEGEGAMRIAATREDAIARGYKRFLKLTIAFAAPVVAFFSYAIMNVNYVLTQMQPERISIGGTIAVLSLVLCGTFAIAVDKLSNAIDSIKDAKRINSGGEILEED